MRRPVLPQGWLDDQRQAAPPRVYTQDAYRRKVVASRDWRDQPARGLRPGLARQRRRDRPAASAGAASLATSQPRQRCAFPHGHIARADDASAPNVNHGAGRRWPREPPLEKPRAKPQVRRKKPEPAAVAQSGARVTTIAKAAPSAAPAQSQPTQRGQSAPRRPRRESLTPSAAAPAPRRAASARGRARRRTSPSRRSTTSRSTPLE